MYPAELHEIGDKIWGGDWREDDFDNRHIVVSAIWQYCVGRLCRPDTEPESVTRDRLEAFGIIDGPEHGGGGLVGHTA